MTLQAIENQLKGYLKPYQTQYFHNRGNQVNRVESHFPGGSYTTTLIRYDSSGNQTYAIILTSGRYAGFIEYEFNEHHQPVYAYISNEGWPDTSLSYLYNERGDLVSIHGPGQQVRTFIWEDIPDTMVQDSSSNTETALND